MTHKRIRECYLLGMDSVKVVSQGMVICPAITTDFTKEFIMHKESLRESKAEKARRIRSKLWLTLVLAYKSSVHQMEIVLKICILFLNY